MKSMVINHQVEKKRASFCFNLQFPDWQKTVVLDKQSCATGLEGKAQIRQTPVPSSHPSALQHRLSPGCWRNQQCRFSKVYLTLDQHTVSHQESHGGLEACSMLWELPLSPPKFSLWAQTALMSPPAPGSWYDLSH